MGTIGLILKISTPILKGLKDKQLHCMLQMLHYCSAFFC